MTSYRLPIWTVDDNHTVRIKDKIALHSELRFYPKYGSTGRHILEMWIGPVTEYPPRSMLVKSVQPQ